MRFGKLGLTEEDEILMNDIMEEIEAKEKLAKLTEQQLAAQKLREQHLLSIKQKARGMRSRPQTRADQFWKEDNGTGGREEKG